MGRGGGGGCPLTRGSVNDFPFFFLFFFKGSPNLHACCFQTRLFGTSLSDQDFESRPQRFEKVKTSAPIISRSSQYI